MNLIGHNYIAKEVLSRYNPLIAAGVHLPDLVPFVSTSAFSFDEIHENPDQVYKYLLNGDIKYLDLSLGMMSHSVKYGADKFNGEIDKWLLSSNEELKNEIAEKIVSASSINIEIAKGPRMHNYLWCGLDFYLIDKYPEFINEIKKNYNQANIEKISEILSQAYDKDINKVKDNIEKHIKLVNKYNISSKTEFVKFWRDFASELPQKDNIDVDKALSCIQFIEDTFKDKWQGVIDAVVKDIRLRMREYI
jgi:hypothetical protein